jgi:hypothetical protein
MTDNDKMREAFEKSGINWVGYAVPSAALDLFQGGWQAREPEITELKARFMQLYNASHNLVAQFKIGDDMVRKDGVRPFIGNSIDGCALHELEKALRACDLNQKWENENE